MDREANREAMRGANHLPDADALRRKAAERPGIREVMRVYEDWKRADRGMATYRAVTKWAPVTRNRANADDR